jgi:hypothetical protein
MFNFNLFESLNLDFACCKNEPKVKEPQYVLDKNIYNVTREYKVSILPITANFDIDNLYPLTDHVELWNIFIVGNDKTYILANIKDPHIVIPNSDDLHNHQAKNILPSELEKILDSIWDQTLRGVKLQFYMVWNGKLYFVNTYPLRNGKNLIIGATMFMRAFETMPEAKFAQTMDGNLIPLRFSEDKQDSAKTMSVSSGEMVARNYLSNNNHSTK